jgi:D-glycero-D-manno-heptose 1,7-bisphosphate phosphatase
VAQARLAGVLFDRDGTLIEDVPYNGDPATVRPMPTARAALRELRRRGIPVGVVSNQSGIARGVLTDARVREVNAAVQRLLGPMDVWRYCPHGPDDGCRCRKPLPGMVLDAAERLGVPASALALIGDIGADMAAAAAAGARAVLVPTPVTRRCEVAAAPAVAPSLLAAVRILLDTVDGDLLDGRLLDGRLLDGRR